ncbi:MAG: hypothetical protein WC277_12235 [Bacilli bacterium]
MPITNVEDLPELPRTLRMREPSALEPPCAGSIETAIEAALEAEASRAEAPLRAAAFRKYMAGASLEKLTREVAKSAPGLPADVVLFWARDGDWARRLRAQNDERERVVRENLRKLRLESAEGVARRSIKLGTEVSRRAEAMVSKEGLKAFELKSLADAGKAAGDMVARGMGETGESAGGDGLTPRQKDGRKPLVIVFGGAGATPVMKKVEVTDTGE